MTVTLESLNEEKLQNYHNKRKYNCRMTFTRFTKKRFKNKDNNKEGKINIRTSLIKNEIIGDDNDDFIDNSFMRTCHKFKFYKNNRTDVYNPYDRKLENYNYERDETFCSLTDLDDIVHDDKKKKNKYFIYKNKSLNDYNSCFEKKSKRLKWFRLKRKKKKDYVNEESIKYLNESVCSNFKEANKSNQIQNSSEYTRGCVLNTVNGIKGFSTWII
ncbi:conserved Plasmodium protein, unknown function [Plasmodium sp. gorilla clade G2]|uniref:conserved Plasmodium protein, unknown function n=1 Tax=Plasmodium sp. gorilla clade G2 TaxID=880535 RepID=UPI000D2112E9|nr:conserved Plasmodium protein, unknown function [Plasmodium sp. gorilla clade G2]SOV16780.1 conserved Plasmodium protein, unknown function [Plasmodium sp. gorilla clade G2]